MGVFTSWYNWGFLNHICREGGVYKIYLVQGTLVMQLFRICHANTTKTSDKEKMTEDYEGGRGVHKSACSH